MYPHLQPHQQNQPPNGWVVIRSQMHGKVVDVYGGSCEEGTKVVVWPLQNPPTNNQKWRFEACGNGWYHIVSALHPSLVLDVEGGQARDCTQLIIFNRNSPPERNQMFRLNGNRLESALRVGMVLDIDGASRADGANVILFSQKPARDAVNQAFDLQLVGGPGAEVAVQAAWTAPQASPYGQPIPFGAALAHPYEQPPYNPSTVHTLSFQPLNSMPAAAVPTLSHQPLNSSPAAVGNWAVIRSQMNGKVLDVEGGQARAGTSIVLWQANFSKNQQWRLESTGTGWCHIISALNPNLVLDVEEGQARPGAPIVLWDRQLPAQANQMFRMKGECIESALGAGLVLDIEGGSQEDGANLIVFPEKFSGDRINQAFVLQSI